VADLGNNAIKKIPAGGGTPVVVGTGFTQPAAVAVDPVGNLFVADRNNNAVKEILAGSGTTVAIGGTGFNFPLGVAVDGAGNVYVGDYGNNALKVIKPVGGYYINKTLPTGLSFSNTTGTISGTPTVASPATNYVITAYNDISVSGTATLSIRTGANNANLAGLTISSGTLTPAFATATTSYTASIANATTSVTVTPTTSDTHATVTVNGVAVASGSPSASLPMAIGSNVITTVVTAQNGSTTKTYTITVTRATGPVPGPLNGALSVSTGENPSDKLQNDGIVVHQGVTPNGDGINDFLQIDNIASYPDNRLAIMNRNGQLIYEAKGYDNSSKVFDGHSNKNGQMQLPGTYFYLLDYTVNGITKHKTGFLVLKY
jgi:gliding motility-associated-like protein